MNERSIVSNDTKSYILSLSLSLSLYLVSGSTYLDRLLYELLLIRP